MEAWKPVLAKLAEIPEESEFTSVENRIEAMSEVQSNSAWLSPIQYETTDETQTRRPGLFSFDTQTYLELVDWTGRCIREDKPGSIPEPLDSSGSYAETI
jgi:hypothetical protein